MGISVRSVRSASLLLAVVGLAGLSSSNSATISKPLAVDAAPGQSFDQGMSTVAVPFLADGRLTIAFVRKPSRGARTTSEVGRIALPGRVLGIVDTNRDTGEFLYQVNIGASDEDVSQVETWLGNPSGHSRLMYRGAGFVRLSPGANFVAATDGLGTMHLADMQGHERAQFEKASDIVFSRDGTKLAFQHIAPYSLDDIGGIEVVDLRSGLAATSFQIGAGKATAPLAFSRSGDVVYFAAQNMSAIPGSADRVDVYALSAQGSSAPRLITRSSHKLPYLDYRRAFYVPESQSLVLQASHDVWIVNTSTGAVRQLRELGDVFWAGSGSTVLARIRGESGASTIWTVTDLTDH